MKEISRILIVDDDVDLCKLSRTTLSSNHRDIREAGTALDGLRCANDMPPDIMLLDIGLPGHFDGFSLCEALAKDARHRGLQIVVISGYDDYVTIERARRLNVAVFMVKPFSPKALAAQIKHLEDERESGRMVVIDKCAS